MKGREFPIVAVIIFLVLGLSLARWVFGFWDGAKPVETETTTDGSRISITKKESDDRRSYAQKKEGYATELYKEWVRNWFIRDKAEEIERAKAEGQALADKKMRDDLNKRIEGSNFGQEALA